MRFDHILVDPAWAYNNRLSGKGRTKFGSGASGKYRVEKTSEMAKFRVQDLANDTCHLHLWVTGPFLQDAFTLISAWGFTYKTIEFCWVKLLKSLTRNNLQQRLYSSTLESFMTGVTRTLPGHYTASNVELVLLATTKDVYLPKVRMRPQVIYQAPMSHSRKPDDVHEWIEQAYPRQRYVELFARRERDGWVTLGDEIDGLDLRESIPMTVGEISIPTGPT
jgi:N6-adenosine-specific RNA methylase IME4